MCCWHTALHAALLRLIWAIVSRLSYWLAVSASPVKAGAEKVMTGTASHGTVGTASIVGIVEHDARIVADASTGSARNFEPVQSIGKYPLRLFSRTCIHGALLLQVGQAGENRL